MQFTIELLDFVEHRKTLVKKTFQLSWSEGTLVYTCISYTVFTISRSNAVNNLTGITYRQSAIRLYQIAKRLWKCVTKTIMQLKMLMYLGPWLAHIVSFGMTYCSKFSTCAFERLTIFNLLSKSSCDATFVLFQQTRCKNLKISYFLE